MRSLDVVPLVVAGLTGSGSAMVANVAIADWTARRRIDGNEVDIELIEEALNAGSPVIVTAPGGTLLRTRRTGRTREACGGVVAPTPGRARW